MTKHKDSEGNEFEAEPSDKQRQPTESPYDCQICGKPANSPAYKRYCWDHYYKKTNGRVFD